MRHLTHNSSLEIWVLEDMESLSRQGNIWIVEGTEQGSLIQYGKVPLPELTEEQAYNIQFNQPPKHESKKVYFVAYELIMAIIDQLLKENGLNGLRVGDYPENVEVEGHGWMMSQEECEKAQQEYDSKVPPEKIIIKI